MTGGLDPSELEDLAVLEHKPHLSDAELVWLRAAHLRGDPSQRARVFRLIERAVRGGR